MNNTFNRAVLRFIEGLLTRKGYQLTRFHDYSNYSQIPYYERDEYGASNLQTKLNNVAMGEPFEYPDIINLNQAVAMLSRQFYKIIELGSGTGKYVELMAKDSSRLVVGSEHDYDTYNWCLDNIVSYQNLHFLNREDPSIYGPYTLSVAIEVVEHVYDYSSFLRALAALAPTSIITTPNRARSQDDYHVGPPNYIKHVREWTAGEFYWVLRSFWRDVELYALPSNESPIVRKVNIDTRLSPLIAVCKNPTVNQELI